MTDRKPPKSAPRAPHSERLGAALRENLKRRKAQAKGRAMEAGERAEPEAPQAPNSAGFPNHKRTGNA
jgi:hypothetical protein